MTEIRQPYRAGPLPPAGRLVEMAEAAEGFGVRRADGITALNYSYVTGDPRQFDFPYSEMRGLMIDEQAGEVLARPFQKFWNVGERGADGTDWDESHVILSKLDGSLVFPAGERLVTRGGVTDTAGKAERIAAGIGGPFQDLLRRLRRDGDGAGCTPLFEYVSPNNQIVIRYPYPRLVLLAVRRIADGAYWPMERVRGAWECSARSAGVHNWLGIVEPAGGVPEAGSPDYARALAAAVSGWPADSEGVVVAFEPSGHRVKIKSEEYVALHRARDSYSSESSVLRVWCDGNTEDLLGRLSGERARRLSGYYDDVGRRVKEQASVIGREAAGVWGSSQGDRRTAALAWTGITAGREHVRPVGFSVFRALDRGGDPVDAADEHIRVAVRRCCARQRLIDEKIRPLLGEGAPVWRPADGNFADAE